MLQYVTDVLYPHDDEKELARRVEIYRQQIAAHDAKRDARLHRGPYARPVRCIDLGRTFPSVQAVATFLGADRSAVRKAIRAGKPVKGLRFRYAGASHRVATGKEHAVRCITLQRTFISITQAASAVGLSPSGLSGALKESHGAAVVCGGMMWVMLSPAEQLTLYGDCGEPVCCCRLPRRAKAPSLDHQLALFN